MAPSAATRLPYHRRKSGLTQREVARIIALKSDVQIFRYEKGSAIAPLIAAIGFEVLFQTSITELFPGLHEAVRLSVEASLADLEHQLQQSRAKGRAAQVIAQKLEWITMRKE